jgi:hypothetical protein
VVVTGAICNLIWKRIHHLSCIINLVTNPTMEKDSNNFAINQKVSQQEEK